VASWVRIKGGRRAARAVEIPTGGAMPKRLPDRGWPPARLRRTLRRPSTWPGRLPSSDRVLRSDEAVVWRRDWGLTELQKLAILGFGAIKIADRLGLEA
jgi:hypothetical protein